MAHFIVIFQKKKKSPVANFIWKKKKRLRGKNVRKENEKEWGRDNMEEMRGGGEGGGGGEEGK